MSCAATGVFSPAQAMMAAEAGAAYVIPYVSRATRLLPEGGPQLVRDIVQVLPAKDCQVLAASLKSPAEAVATLLAGAHHLSLPWDVLSGMAHHPLTEQALVEFDQAIQE
jgi:transaldolase